MTICFRQAVQIIYAQSLKHVYHHWMSKIKMFVSNPKSHFRSLQSHEIPAKCLEQLKLPLYLIIYSWITYFYMGVRLHWFLQTPNSHFHIRHREFQLHRSDSCNLHLKHVHIAFPLLSPWYYRCKLKQKWKQIVTYAAQMNMITFVS